MRSSVRQVGPSTSRSRSTATTNTSHSNACCCSSIATASPRGFADRERRRYAEARARLETRREGRPARSRRDRGRVARRVESAARDRRQERRSGHHRDGEDAELDGTLRRSRHRHGPICALHRAMSSTARSRWPRATARSRCKAAAARTSPTHASASRSPRSAISRRRRRAVCADSSISKASGLCARRERPCRRHRARFDGNRATSLELVSRSLISARRAARSNCSQPARRLAVQQFDRVSLDGKDRDAHELTFNARGDALAIQTQLRGVLKGEDWSGTLNQLKLALEGSARVGARAAGRPVVCGRCGETRRALSRCTGAAHLPLRQSGRRRQCRRPLSHRTAAARDDRGDRFARCDLHAER